MKRTLSEPLSIAEDSTSSIIKVHSVKDKKRLPAIGLGRNLIVTLTFLFLGMCLGYSEGWSFVDSLYFVVTTLTTVGYGDLTLKDKDLLASGFIFLGLLVFGSAFTYIFDAALETSRNYAKMMADKDAHRGENVCKSRTELLFIEARHRLYCDLGQSVCGIVIIGLGAAVVGTLEGWSTSKSIYWSVTTFSTTGYGDVTPRSCGGRLLASALMLCGVLLFGRTLGFLVSFHTLIDEIKAQEEVLTQFGKDLTKPELLTLSHGREMQELNLCASKDNVTKAEFCLMMLFKLGRVSKEELFACQEAFDHLDRTDTGYLSMEDCVSVGRVSTTS